MTSSRQILSTHSFKKVLKTSWIIVFPQPPLLNMKKKNINQSFIPGASNSCISALGLKNTMLLVWLVWTSSCWYLQTWTMLAIMFVLIKQSCSSQHKRMWFLYDCHNKAMLTTTFHLDILFSFIVHQFSLLCQLWRQLNFVSLLFND